MRTCTVDAELQAALTCLPSGLLGRCAAEWAMMDGCASRSYTLGVVLRVDSPDRDGES